MDEWLTIPEAAAYFGVTENAIRMRVKRRKYANTEIRDGRTYIQVNTDRSETNALVVPTGPVANPQIERLIAAQEETNRLLAELLDKQAKRFKWWWQ